MKVLKFGGTSVGTPESLASVRNIIERETEPCVVTVSALGGLTDRLIKTAALAASGCGEYLREYEEICARHRRVCEAVVPSGYMGDCWGHVKDLLDELGTIFKAISLLGELTKRSHDLVVSYGERMSSIIVSSMFPGAALVDALEVIRTREHFGKSVLDAEETSRRIRERFALLKDRPVTVIGGFISRDADGHITNLGRGGSDYTAAILAAELGARVLEIWTDVDGFMTADPRKVRDARVIDRLSFVEAMELCNFGAKVVYPPTIYPVFNRNIPIIIKNTFNPSVPGTLIGDAGARGPETWTPVGVSAIADTRLLSLEGAGAGMYERMVNTLTRQGIELLMPDGRCSCGLRGADAERALDLLREEFAAELVDSTLGGLRLSDPDSLVALVGNGDAGAPEPADLAEALNEQGVPVVQGPLLATSGTLACMVPQPALDDALNIIHSKFITL